MERAPKDVLPVVPHMLHGVDEPTTFGVEFVVAAPGDTPGRRRDWVFYYEITADRRQILSETLVRVRGRDEEVLFERGHETWSSSVIVRGIEPRRH
ncbi:hypothetical protein [Actinomyces slackii]|uniref:hypothetical protein n=1 Tax=Actinomyces slackii TaxID=52774 RepID=UPI000408C639|nr:hypothetical protein [Actinomyces slackii]